MNFEEELGGVNLDVVMTNDLRIAAVFEPSHRISVGNEQDLTDGFRLKIEGEAGSVY